MAKPDPETIAKIESRVNFELSAVMLLLVLSIIAPLTAWFGVLQLEDNAAVWFQRSGSMAVLFAAWAEYLVFIVRGRINPISDGGVTYQDMANQGVLETKYRRILRVINFISITMLIVGTIIWGYGDLFK